MGEYMRICTGMYLIPYQLFITKKFLNICTELKNSNNIFQLILLAKVMSHYNFLIPSISNDEFLKFNCPGDIALSL